TATATDRVTDPPGDPPAAAFVAQLYEDLLHRPVDAAGLAAWTGLLAGGGSRAAVAEGILASLEYRTNQVQEQYQRLLHRPADPFGLNVFTAFLVDGGTAGQVMAQIVGSPEYAQARGGDGAADFLTALYQDALRRAPDPAGLDNFTQALAAGAPRA